MPAQPTILIVEDDRFLERMYSAKLTREGMRVLTAGDGEEALALLKRVVPDAVLLDIIMPKLDGLAVLRAMRLDERLKKVPVILLTNLSEGEEVKAARDLGANEYLVKANFLPSEVMEAIRKYVVH